MLCEKNKNLEFKQELMCLAPGHNTVMPVGLKATTPSLESSTLKLSHCTPHLFYAIVQGTSPLNIV